MEELSGVRAEHIIQPSPGSHVDIGHSGLPSMRIVLSIERACCPIFDHRSQPFRMLLTGSGGCATRSKQELENLFEPGPQFPIGTELEIEVSLPFDDVKVIGRKCRLKRQTKFLSPARRGMKSGLEYLRLKGIRREIAKNGVAPIAKVQFSIPFRI